MYVVYRYLDPLGDTREGVEAESSVFSVALLPRGSKYPILEVSGSKKPTLHGS